MLIGQVESPSAADLDQVVALLELVLELDETTAAECLDKLVQQAQSGELNGARLAALRGRLEKTLQPALAADPKTTLHHAATLLATLWRDEAAANRARAIVFDESQSQERRSSALHALAAVQDANLLQATGKLLTAMPTLQSALLAAFAHYESPEVARDVLRVYPQLPAGVQPQAIQLLTQRTAWSKQLVAAVANGALPSSVVNENQLRALQRTNDAE